MKNFFKHFNKNKKRGFTLIETLIAISVLMMAFTGPVAIATRGLVAAIYSKNEITAIYLAEEGVEVIRNMRDNNVLSNQSWIAGFGACFLECSVDATSFLTPVAACPAAGCPAVNYDSTSGLYGLNPSWTPSSFTRSVTVTSLDSNQIVVTSKVTWNQLGVQQVLIKDILFNWQ